IMCCIAYENETYVQNASVLPKINQKVKTPNGDGIVMYVNILEKKVTLKTLDGEEKLEEYRVEDLVLDEQ
ncbi:MAG: stage 0 sporulation protein, partial [Clostridia bacterium]|nr:stage 0 sporulation protein [Clostridia bacterium]